MVGQLAAAGGKHPQRMFVATLNRAAFHDLVNDLSVPLATRCRIRQCSQVGALKFQHAVPTTPERTLGNAAYLANWRHCYGLDQPELFAGTRCHSRCPTHGPDRAIDQDDFATGAHCLSCRTSCHRLRRHNNYGRNVLKPFYVDMGYEYDDSDIYCHLDSGKRIDATCRDFSRTARPVGIDITVGCPACPSYVCDSAARSATHVTDALERGKRAKHGDACARANLDLLPAALTSYGGWGSAIIAVVHREYAARAKAEKASGGSGWESQRWYQDLLERASVSIARSNYEMLRNNRSLPRA